MISRCSAAGLVGVSSTLGPFLEKETVIKRSNRYRYGEQIGKGGKINDKESARRTTDGRNSFSELVNFLQTVIRKSQKKTPRHSFFSTKASTCSHDCIRKLWFALMVSKLTVTGRQSGP